MADYVLGHFNGEEIAVMKDSLERTQRAVNLILEGKVDAAMNEYNTKNRCKDMEENQK